MIPTGSDARHATGESHLDEAFDHAAPRYDLLTRLNPGYHAALRRAASALMRLVGRGSAEAPRHLWDVGCGSGLSTVALSAAAGEHAEIIGVDASQGMLDQARAKPWPAGVRFVHAMAQHLPDVAVDLDAPPADGVTAAYLVRNVPAHERDAVLTHLAGVVHPGGWVVLQDYHVDGRSRAAVWTMVCWGVVMPLAVLLRANPSIYRYLWRSVLDNDTWQQLDDRLRRTGFTDIVWHHGTGWQRGILHTVAARVAE